MGPKQPSSLDHVETMMFAVLVFRFFVNVGHEQNARVFFSFYITLRYVSAESS